MVAKKKNNDVAQEKNNNLRQIEEVIARSHQDVVIDEDAPLQKKTNNKELLARLMEIEQAIMRRALAKGIIGKD